MVVRRFPSFTLGSDADRRIQHRSHCRLGNCELRDLNGEINYLMREKRHWEKQMIALAARIIGMSQCWMTMGWR